MLCRDEILEVLVVCLAGCSEHYSETVSTTSFSSRTQNLSDFIATVTSGTCVGSLRSNGIPTGPQILTVQ